MLERVCMYNIKCILYIHYIRSPDESVDFFFNKICIYALNLLTPTTPPLLVSSFPFFFFFRICGNMFSVDIEITQNVGLFRTYTFIYTDI